MTYKSLTLDDVQGHYALLWLNSARYGPGAWLLFIDRKSQISFQMTWKSSFLDDIENHWQPAVIL